MRQSAAKLSGFVQLTVGCNTQQIRNEKRFVAAQNPMNSLPK